MKENLDQLKKEAVLAMKKSYSPYSRVKVGAALLARDGSVFRGANVENASYGLSMCAERVALFKAVSEGHRDFGAIAITSTIGAVSPCGACRQALSEFGLDMKVISTSGRVEKSWVLRELLPDEFGLDHKALGRRHDTRKRTNS